MARFVLVTGRSTQQGMGKETGKLSARYFGSVSICEIDPDDLKELGVAEGSPVRVTSSVGNVVVKAVKSPKAPHRGIVFVPYGPYASMIVGCKTDGTGMPSFKGVEVEVEPAPNEKVQDATTLIRSQYG